VALCLPPYELQIGDAAGHWHPSGQAMPDMIGQALCADHPARTPRQANA
jgi:hypothetical protein